MSLQKVRRLCNKTKTRLTDNSYDHIYDVTIDAPEGYSFGGTHAIVFSDDKGNYESKASFWSFVHEGLFDYIYDLEKCDSECECVNLN